MLPILLKIGGRLFPAPTQLLPEVGAGVDGSLVLQSLEKTLKGCIPDPGAKLVVTSETWAHKQYRLATRNLLVGLANALQQIMPPNFKMSHFKPDNPLTPRGSSTRVQLLPMEIELLSFGKYSSDKVLYFFWSGDEDKVVRAPDFYLQPESFYRLTFSGDEGTDVFWLNLVSIPNIFQHIR